MKFLFTVLFALIITLAPAYSTIQPFDLINNVVNMKIINFNTIQISGNTLVLSRSISIPAGNYLYVKYFGFDYDLAGSWTRRIIPIGSRALVYLFIANTFYDIMNNYLEAVNQYNNIYDAFLSQNPGMGQGSYLVLRNPFPLSYKWRLACQGSTIKFNYEYRNERINVFDDQEFLAIYPLTSAVVGNNVLFLISNFTGEYMNTLVAQYRGISYAWLYKVYGASATEYFGEVAGGGLISIPVSQAYVGASVGVMINPYLDAYLEGVRVANGVVDVAGYLEGVLEGVNELALEREYVLEGTPGVLIRGYVFPAVETTSGLEIPEGMVIPLGANATFEQDVELASESSPAVVDVQVEAPPSVEDEVDRDKNNWLMILQDLQNKFPFSIPYTYSYLFTLVTSYSYSDYVIINDIEAKINNLFSTAFGRSIVISLDVLTPLITMLRTFGTLIMIFLLVVGYRRLLM
jgi:hypothetical protein